MIRTLREEGVRVFALLRQDTLNKPAEHRRSTKAATQAAQKTGGDVLRVDNEKDLDKGLERLASELQGSYRMDYEPGAGVATQEKLQIESTRPNVTLLYPRD